MGNSLKARLDKSNQQFIESKQSCLKVKKKQILLDAATACLEPLPWVSYASVSTVFVSIINYHQDDIGKWKNSMENIVKWLKWFSDMTNKSEEKILATWWIEQYIHADDTIKSLNNLVKVIQEYRIPFVGIPECYATTYAVEKLFKELRTNTHYTEFYSSLSLYLFEEPQRQLKKEWAQIICKTFHNLLDNGMSEEEIAVATLAFTSVCLYTVLPDPFIQTKYHVYTNFVQQMRDYINMFKHTNALLINQLPLHSIRYARITLNLNSKMGHVIPIYLQIPLLVCETWHNATPKVLPTPIDTSMNMWRFMDGVNIQAALSAYELEPPRRLIPHPAAKKRLQHLSDFFSYIAITVDDSIDPSFDTAKTDKSSCNNKKEEEDDKDNKENVHSTVVYKQQSVADTTSLLYDALFKRKQPTNSDMFNILAYRLLRISEEEFDLPALLFPKITTPEDRSRPYLPCDYFEYGAEFIDSDLNQSPPLLQSEQILPLKKLLLFVLINFPYPLLELIVHYVYAHAPLDIENTVAILL